MGDDQEASVLYKHVANLKPYCLVIYFTSFSKLYFTSNRLPVAEFSSKLTLDMYASDFDSIFVLMIKFCFYLLRSQVGKSLL